MVTAISQHFWQLILAFRMGMIINDFQCFESFPPFHSVLIKDKNLVLLFVLMFIRK